MKCQQGPDVSVSAPEARSLTQEEKRSLTRSNPDAPCWHLILAMHRPPRAACAACCAQCAWCCASPRSRSRRSRCAAPAPANAADLRGFVPGFAVAIPTAPVTLVFSKAWPRVSLRRPRPRTSPWAPSRRGYPPSSRCFAAHARRVPLSSPASSTCGIRFGSIACGTQLWLDHSAHGSVSP